MRYRQEGTAPVQFCTVLFPYPAGGDVSVEVSPLAATIDDRLPNVSELTSLRIETDTHVDYLVVDRGPVGARKAFAGYETDAQLVYLRHQKDTDRPVKVMMREGRQLLFQGQSLLREDESAEYFTLDGEL